MVAVKLHDNKDWLRRRYVIDKMTPAQIAERAGCSQITIYRRLREFGLLK